jgi:hypothetical protein
MLNFHRTFCDWKGCIRGCTSLYSHETEWEKREAIERVSNNTKTAERCGYSNEKNSNKQIVEWTATDLKILLKPNKLKQDGAMPSNKNKLIELYQKCVSRNNCMSLLGQPHTDINLLNVGDMVSIQAEMNNTTELNDAPITGKIEMQFYKCHSMRVGGYRIFVLRWAVTINLMKLKFFKKAIVMTTLKSSLDQLK